MFEKEFEHKIGFLVDGEQIYLCVRLTMVSY